MPKTFYLFRHAQAIPTGSKYTKKTKLAAEIMPEKLEPIVTLARYLNYVPQSLNVSSPVLRCQQTAKIVAELADKKFIHDNRLREYYHETFNDFKNRSYDFFGEIMASEYQNIVLCTHGIVIAYFKHFFLKHNFTGKDRHDHIQPGELLIAKEGRIEILDFNRGNFLPTSAAATTASAAGKPSTSEAGRKTHGRS